MRAGRTITTAGADEVVVWLELGPLPGRIHIDGDGLTESFPLPIGTSDVVALFRRDPPTEGELETAIELIEEAVMPLVKRMPNGAVLVAASDLVRELVNWSTGSKASLVASLDAVEARFEQMALAARRGAWSREVVMDPSTCAGLLILREFMHHAGFDRIEVRKKVTPMAGKEGV
jgi:hypothetical protein